ncbi:hypothetical protein SAMN05444267_103838 [Chryseobacterium polytrichastri]|uniref:Branched-chain amino acid:cation transporter, LIVCS family n=1 Tax=Chryseobacterium polytrichastri TaxID=1302687 RepID=A0A1M7H0K4_9FLAO|nr:hypothetical protein SAMN05444267_103838 [Chryseobacterium polytrichastri]
MNNSTIKNIGKYTFWTTFLLGNIFLFGFIFSHIIEFAIASLFFLSIGSLINAVIFFGLLIYGGFYQNQFVVCLESALIILLNIPVLLFYSFLFYN